MTELRVPVMVTDVDAETPVVVIVKVAVVEPAATVTDAGTVAFELLDVKATTVPPVPAAEFSVTVPVDEVPPVTELGDTVTLCNPTGLIVNVAVTFVPA